MCKNVLGYHFLHSLDTRMSYIEQFTSAVPKYRDNAYFFKKKRSKNNLVSRIITNWQRYVILTQYISKRDLHTTFIIHVYNCLMRRRQRQDDVKLFLLKILAGVCNTKSMSSHPTLKHNECSIRLRLKLKCFTHHAIKILKPLTT